MAFSVTKCVNFQQPAKKYETTTGKVHRFIASIPQEFDCRVKPHFKPETLNKDIKIKNEELKSVYQKEYVRKSVGVEDKWYKVPRAPLVQYLRTVEEKLVSEPPPPLEFRLSEMKDSYRINYIEPHLDDIQAPINVSKCIISRVGSEEQPAIPPQRKGFWKWTDPYLTINRSSYVPYDDEVDTKIKSEIATFYNIERFDLPPISGNKVMFDRLVCKNVMPNRVTRIPTPIVSNYGMQSEHQGNYVRQTFSELYPLLQDESCITFEDSLSPASRYQTMTVPGMYCSEYCNYGRKAVRSVVDPNFKKKEVIRTKGCCRLYD